MFTQGLKIGDKVTVNGSIGKIVNFKQYDNKVWAIVKFENRNTKEAHQVSLVRKTN